MIKKIKIFIILTSFIIFLSLIANYYFSEKNIILTNKSRSTYALSSYDNLPILKNDTNNIIVYKDELNEFKKKRKKRIWENIIK